MGLRINQNIAALNAARNLRITDGAMSRSLERLSSGFRINRAADDPAGLIISENLRAQVSGLGQAIRNASTAVNLIKTAEASLDEALKQLRSIRTLALDALNTGAADSVALAADQTAIASSIASLTRIGQNTQFGKIKLLDGSAGVTGSTSDSNVLSFISATEKTQTGTFKVESIVAATKGEITRTLNNEFQSAAGAPNTAIKLEAGEVLTFQVDFGTQAGLSASDVTALGADLKAAGLVADTSQKGVTVQFDETNATAFVIVDQAAGGFTVDTVDGAVSLRAALNLSSIGKVLTFNDDGDLAGGTANEFRVTGKYAGLGFSLSDLSAADGVTFGDDTIKKADAGFTANAAKLTAGAALGTAADIPVGNTVKFTVDFGNGLTTSAEKAALGAALAAGGLKTATVTRGTSTTAISFNATTAVATVTITNGSGDEYNLEGATNISDNLITDLNNTTTHGLGRFVQFSDDEAASKLEVITAIGSVKFTDAGGTSVSGFGAGQTIGAAGAAVAAAEVADLGLGRTEGSDTAQGTSAVKVLQETLTFNGDKVVTVGSGTLVVNLANVINQQLISLGVGVTTAVTLGVAAGSTVKLTNNAFGTSAATGGKNTVSSNRSDLHNPHLNVGGIAVTIEGTDATGKLNGITAVGVGQDLSASGTSFSGNAAEGLKVRFTGTTDPTGLTVTVSQGSLTFQVGANNGQTVSQQLADVRSAQLGKTATGLTTAAKSVADINVTTGAGAADALRLVDAAIDQVTTARGNLGAFQANVLESTIASLGVAQENLAAAESAVRDADFAEETVQFTRNQILLQAGTAILTQANAIPQAVLQLLR